MKLTIRIILTSLSLVTMVAWAQEPTSLQEQYQALVESYFAYYEKGEIDEAQSALEQALTLIPDAESNFLLRGNLAEILVARGDTVPALEQLSIALGERPGVEALRVRRAELLEEKGLLQEALMDLDQLVANAPDKEVRRFNRARVRSRLELYEGAANDLQYIIEHNDAAYLPRIALAEVEEKRGNAIEAERILSHLINTYPATPIAYRRRAELLMRQERKAEALADIRKVINDLQPVEAEDYRIRAEIWLLYGEKAMAERDFAKAESLSASSTEKDL
ncbi:MAG: tetratricopeptide repeat protein [Porphyromonas sp.]|nr:tetratricopeptide repeat protein [Porphyromonas sp.]